MEEKIIVYPTDFSACSENAFDYVKSIAKATVAKVKVVHSLDLTALYATQITPADTSILIESLETNAKVKLDEIKNALEKEFIPCETVLLNGVETNWLQKLLKETQPSLVIMGTTGSNELENRIFGSLTHKIIMKAEFPILAVPKHAKYKGIREIVFATDYKTSDVEHIQYVINMTKKYYPRLDIVHVSQGEFTDNTEELFIREFEDELFSKVSYPKMNVRLLYSTNSEERLNELMKESKADLLVLVSTQRTFFERIFSYSLTKKMVYHSDTPLLVF